MSGRRWVRVVGDGCIYSGPCLVHSVTLVPDGTDDYATIYDGRDSVSGRLFVQLKGAYKLTRQLTFGDGAPFDQGIYVDARDTAVETTVVFTPL